MASVFTVMDAQGRVHPARPFRDGDHMNQVLLERYRATVTPEDTVWWLGDVCFKPTQALLSAIASLPGKRYLILGNHDRERAERYAAMGFTKLRSSWTTERMLFTHIPVHPSNLTAKVPVNVHGHTHMHLLDGPYVNVCVEHTEFAPLAWPVVVARAQQSLVA